GIATCLQRAQAILANTGHLGVLYIDLSDLDRIEREYGQSVYADVLERLGPAIASISPEAIRAGDIVTSGFQDQASVVVFLSEPRDGRAAPTPGEIQGLSGRV